MLSSVESLPAVSGVGSRLVGAVNPLRGDPRQDLPDPRQCPAAGQDGEAGMMLSGRRPAGLPGMDFRLWLFRHAAAAGRGGARFRASDRTTLFNCGAFCDISL